MASTTNITCPSHIALMTGVHPRDSKITDNQTRMRGVAETLAERFREAIASHEFRCLGTKAPGPVTISGGMALKRWVKPARPQSIAARTWSYVASLCPANTRTPRSCSSANRSAH